MTGFMQKLAGMGKRSTKPRFAEDSRGVAAIEAALILPIAIGLLGLLAIWAQGISIQRKVTLTARTITDLVSQQSSPLARSALDCLLDNASYVLSPYNNTSMTMVVSQILITGVGTTATVTWSEPMPGYGSARPTGSVVTLPSAISAAGSNLIMGEVKYIYTPLVIGQAVGPQTLHDEIYLSPRLAASIVVQ